MNEINFKITEDNCRQPGAVPMRDGIHFGCFGSGKETPVLLLYKKGTQEIVAELPFPETGAGDLYYAMKVKLPTEAYEYNFREGDRIFTDPYARKICGRETFGTVPADCAHALRGGFMVPKYSWENDRLPAIPFEDAVMYHLHVRGFTMQKNSGVRKKGTYSGLKEKIPYLKKLGVNQLKLMPVYEFAEVSLRVSRHQEPPQTQQEAAKRAFELPEPMTDSAVNRQNQSLHWTEGTSVSEKYRTNFWGYGVGYYFAPKHSYAAGEHPDTELKDLVKALHANDIELLLEFCFTEDTDISMITECLSYWACEYHIDGFSVIARESVTAELARLPLFRTRKLICGWHPEYIKGWNERIGHRFLAESNDGFMNDCRRLLKGDESCLEAFSCQLRSHPEGCAKVNYLTNHDGFTLMDLVSYEHKHNLANGENDRDGTDYNYSWNCGCEGPSAKKAIAALRMRQRKNAYAMLLFSQGVPMLLAGDEFGNSQEGNNNPYCHDSELSWVDWSTCRRQKELTEFVEKAIAYRKAHRVLHQAREPKLTDHLSSGYPALSFHSERAWYGDFCRSGRHLGCMYSGRYAGEEGFVYIAWNFHWNPKEFALPSLPKGQTWRKVMDTSLKESFPEEDAQEKIGEVKAFTVPGRTIIILEGK